VGKSKRKKEKRKKGKRKNRKGKNMRAAGALRLGDPSRISQR
jgi:hypothetical protein